MLVGFGIPMTTIMDSLSLFAHQISRRQESLNSSD
jgi:hypothetical protein